MDPGGNNYFHDISLLRVVTPCGSCVRRRERLADWNNFEAQRDGGFDEDDHRDDVQDLDEQEVLDTVDDWAGSKSGVS